MGVCFLSWVNYANLSKLDKSDPTQTLPGILSILYIMQNIIAPRDLKEYNTCSFNMTFDPHYLGLLTFQGMRVINRQGVIGKTYILNLQQLVHVLVFSEL